MDLMSSLLTLTGLGVVALVSIAARTLVKDWIRECVRTASEQKLAQFRSELDAEKAHLAAIRDGVLSGRTSRQAIVDIRRFNAVDDVWKSVREFDRYLMAPKLLSVLKIDAVFDMASENHKIREFFGHLDSLTSVEPIAAVTFNEHYIPRRISKLYHLYVAVVGLSVSIISAAQNGLDPRKLLNLDGMNEQVKEVLPLYTKYLDEFGPYSWTTLTDVIRSAMVEEIRAFVEKTDADMTNLEKLTIEQDILPQTNTQAAIALATIPDELKHTPPTPVETENSKQTS